MFKLLSKSFIGFFNLARTVLSINEAKRFSKYLTFKLTAPGPDTPFDFYVSI